MSVPPWVRSFSLHEAVDKFSVDVIKAKLDCYGDDYNINSLDFTGRTPLHCAVARGFEEIIKLLLEKGAKLDVKDVRGDTPLHYAVLGDNGKSLRILEMSINNVNINVTGQMGQTPLHIAVKRNFESCVRFLQGKGANVNVQDYSGKTPLHYAVLGKNENIFRALVEHELLQADLKDQNGQTPLHVAAKMNFEMGVRLLLKAGSNVNAKDSMGNTPLHYSVFPGKKRLADHKSFVNIFLVNNANLEEKNEEGQTPLHLAVVGNFLPEIELFLNAGAKVNVRDITGRTPLHYANTRKHIKLKMLKMLLENGADVNITDDSDQTPLHRAAAEGFVSRGVLLIRSGADINAKDISLNTPLHLCLSKNSTEFVKLLLEAGSEVDLKDLNGYTPLQIAVEKDLKSVSKLLLNKGAQVNIKDQYGKSPLHVAVSNMNIEIVKKLLQNNADVDCRDEIGQTALHVAAKCTFAKSTLPRCKSVINLLLLNGSDIMLKDFRGKTPLELALIKTTYNSFDIVQFLIEWGGLNADSSLSMIDEGLKCLAYTSSWTLVKIITAFNFKLKCARMISEAPYYTGIKPLVDNRDWEELDRYNDELERMKNTKIEHHALSDILLKYRDLIFLSNNSMKRIIFSSSLTLENEFPFYGTILKATYLKARERYCLIPIVCRTLMLPLPDEIVWKILSYVTDKDLKNIIKARC